MASTTQLSLGPMAVKEVGSVLPTAAKELGTVPLVDQMVRGFLRAGCNAQASAGHFGISSADFSKAFSVNWPERNALMKKFDALPFEMRREVVALLAADYGIAQADSEPVRVLRDLNRMLKAVGE